MQKNEMKMDGWWQLNVATKKFNVRSVKKSTPFKFRVPTQLKTIPTFETFANLRATT